MFMNFIQPKPKKALFSAFSHTLTPNYDIII